MAKLVLGITGGIASGKSTLAGLFAERGAWRVSADEIARELLAPGSAMTRAVLERFGGDIADDSGELPSIDRAKLARRIFGDETARQALGELMHPAIRERTRFEITAGLNDPDSPLVVVEIPLLYENHLEGMVDRVLVAACPEAVQLARLMARRPGLSEEEALRQIRSQMPIAEKAKRADFVIDTDRGLDVVRAEAGELFEGLVLPGD